MADSSRLPLPAPPAEAIDAALGISKTTLIVDGRQTYVYRSVLTDPSADAAITSYLAEMLGAQAELLAAAPSAKTDQAVSPVAPEDLCGGLPTATPGGFPGVEFVVASAIRPTPAITSVRFELTRMDPGSVRQTFADTLVYDAGLGHPVDLADLFVLDQATVARLEALVTTQMQAGDAVAGTPAVAVDLEHFLLLPDGIGFAVRAPDGSLATTGEVVVPYRALTGVTRARIGSPGAPGQTYPAYIEIRPSLAGDPGCSAPAVGPAIALTYDDGPDATGTHAILAELSKRRAVATFCVIGVNSVRHQDILQDIVLQGSEIGNHTWRHLELRRMSAAEVAAEIVKVQRLVQSVTGVAPAFVRPPAGRAGAVARRAFGLPTVYWSIDPYDWRGASAEEIAAHVIERARDGDIVLLHDTALNTAAATGMILDELGARGFRFVTVSELLDLAGGKVPPGSVWRSRAGE